MAALLLSALTVAALVRSFFVTDCFRYSTIKSNGNQAAWTQRILAVGHGGIGFHQFVQWVPADIELSILKDDGGHGFRHWEDPAAYPAFSYADNFPLYGFQFNRSRIDNENSDSGPIHAESVVTIVPLAFPLVIFLVMSAPLFMAWWRRKRRGLGR